MFSLGFTKTSGEYGKLINDLAGKHNLSSGDVADIRAGLAKKIQEARKTLRNKDASPHAFVLKKTRAVTKYRHGGGGGHPIPFTVEVKVPRSGLKPKPHPQPPPKSTATSARPTAPSTQAAKKVSKGRKLAPWIIGALALGGGGYGLHRYLSKKPSESELFESN